MSRWFEKLSFPRPDDWEVGERVVLRFRLMDEDGVTDALGYIIAIDSHQVVIETRRGEITVLWEAAVSGKKVPPPPIR